MARDRDDDSGRVSGLFRPDGTFWVFRKRFDQVGRDAGCNVDGITASRFTRLMLTGLTVSQSHRCPLYSHHCLAAAFG